MKKRLKQTLDATLKGLIEKGKLNRAGQPDYVIEVPKNQNHGHFATNLPLTLASSQKRPPREIANLIVDHLEDAGGIIEKVEIAGPGFINFTLTSDVWHEMLSGVISQGAEYGKSQYGLGQRILVEFVSANPTGPLHLGHGRGAALGDTLCRILSFSGYEVVREFYVNDAGQQIRNLGVSIYSRWKQKMDPHFPFPDGGYHGEYINHLADDISLLTDLSSMNEAEAINFCSERGKEKMLREIREDLDAFRTAFDVWTSEAALSESGRLDAALEIIEKKGELFQKDGALWIETIKFGDDKDRVIRKKDGQYTYFASDIGYHLDKWERGFTKAVNIWGADHHGYVQRVKSALKANGINESWLAVLLIQLVKLLDGGREIKMSKRAGHYVTLRELIDEVGVDAARFVFLTKNHDSPLDFDIELLKKNDSDNPVYYVQYAHARICSIFRKAALEGIDLPQHPKMIFGRLGLEDEQLLIRRIAEFPLLLEEICIHLEPHRLTYYLTDLASIFHRYFNSGTKIPGNRIVSKDKTLSQARLFLADAIRVVLHNGLQLLGIQAPQRM
ncbi:arginine--tRNA ligase [Thermodesulfobacteriota bacterium]